MRCINCGNEVEQGLRFCKRCGKKIEYKPVVDKNNEEHTEQKSEEESSNTGKIGLANDSKINEDGPACRSMVVTNHQSMSQPSVVRNNEDVTNSNVEENTDSSKKKNGLFIVAFVGVLLITLVLIFAKTTQKKSDENASLREKNEMQETGNSRPVALNRTQSVTESVKKDTKESDETIYVEKDDDFVEMTPDNQQNVIESNNRLWVGSDGTILYFDDNEALEYIEKSWDYSVRSTYYISGNVLKINVEINKGNEKRDYKLEAGVSGDEAFELICTNGLPWTNEMFTPYSPGISYYQDCVLPSSSSVVVTNAELSELTEQECLYARNELYARHGYKFISSDLQSYFMKMPWYVGTIDSKDFSESMLNKIEIINRDRIVRYETENHYNGY